MDESIYGQLAKLLSALRRTPLPPFTLTHFLPLQVWTRVRPNPYDHDHLLTSFELQPSTRTAQVPLARHRAAAAFVRPGAVPRYPAGVLVVFGGTTDPWDVAPTGLLGDLWLYDMANHVWARVLAQGLDPAPRSGGAMTSLGAMVSLVWKPEAPLSETDTVIRRLLLWMCFASSAMDSTSWPPMCKRGLLAWPAVCSAVPCVKLWAAARCRPGMHIGMARLSFASPCL